MQIMAGRSKSAAAKHNSSLAREHAARAIFSNSARIARGLCMTVRAIKLPGKQSCITRIDPITSDVRPDADARSPNYRDCARQRERFRAPSQLRCMRVTYTDTYMYIYIYIYIPIPDFRR